MRVAIDAGHGSNTAGKRTPNGYKEHTANVKVAGYFAKAMERCGISYIKTGWDDSDSTDDPDTALSTRQSQIKSAKCDYSISFHFNAYGDGKSYNSAQGVETLISNKSAGDSLRLANKVQAQLVKGTQQVNRGVKSQSLAMCNCKAMGTKASILIECAFMTNEYEAKLMASDAFCREVAEETAIGFCEYLGIAYKTATATVNGSVSYLVKITVDELNIRANIGTNYPVVGVVKRGEVFTIVETVGNWGRLKSGAGWINVSEKYVKRV